MTSQRQLQDVNDKLSDLGLEHLTVAAEDVGGSFAKASPKVLEICRTAFAELSNGSNVPSDMIGFSNALTPLGLKAVYGARPKKIHVLDFLCSELQTERLSRFHDTVTNNNGASTAPSASTTGPTSSSSPAAAELPATDDVSVGAVRFDATITKLSHCLNIPRTDDTAGFLKQVHKEAAKLGGESARTNKLVKEQTVQSQRDVLERINAALRADYRLRRQMLLQRADITVQSFLWTDHVDSEKLAEVCSD